MARRRCAKAEREYQPALFADVPRLVMSDD